MKLRIALATGVLLISAFVSVRAQESDSVHGAGVTKGAKLARNQREIIEDSILSNISGSRNGRSDDTQPMFADFRAPHPEARKYELGFCAVGNLHPSDRQAGER
jgi:hypothetical protein